MIYTYQDFLNTPQDEKSRIEFVRSVIERHKNSPAYNMAFTARQYYCFRNVTIMDYQKLLYTVSGKAIPDNFSANYKLRSNFFYRFVTHQNQYLLSNGVQWQNDSTDDALGNFDTQLQIAGLNALIEGVSFGFWNLDHMDVFRFTEFAPLWDEEDGSLKAGVRFWQIDPTKPLRATLYELDGYTNYIWRNGKDGGEILTPKRAYKVNIVHSEAYGDEIHDGENYAGFPIVPLWGNPNHQSEFEGLREAIDCYDLIKSGFANTVDEASYVYWAIQNAGGMDDIDLAKFVERMKTVHAAIVEDDQAHAEAHYIEAPYSSREALLERLRSDLYEDAMALDTKNIASGAVTATQIEASYEPLNGKTDQYEYCVIEFIERILELAGIDDEPTFTRSIIVNKSEEVTTVLAGATYLEPSYVTEKILNILGDGDKYEDMIKQMDANEIDPLNTEDNADGEKDYDQFG